MGAMPNQPKTPQRTFRAGPIWDEAKAIADQQGESLSEILRAALEQYVKKNRSK
jgi:hypothetical protein